jgi:hypothetical protein
MEEFVFGFVELDILTFYIAKVMWGTPPVPSVGSSSSVYINIKNYLYE